MAHKCHTGSGNDGRVTSDTLYHSHSGVDSFKELDGGGLGRFAYSQVTNRGIYFKDMMLEHRALNAFEQLEPWKPSLILYFI